MMKFFAVAGVIAFVAGGFFYFSPSKLTPEEVEDAKHAEWKYNQEEPEAAVRPESYQAMKWTPSDETNRMPASVKPAKDKSKKK